MRKAKLISFIILLKRYHRSGWIPFYSKEKCGMSTQSYKKYFSQVAKAGLLRKGKRGYFISGFNTCLSSIYGDHSKYIRIQDKTGGFYNIVEWVLMAHAHHRIKQQYASAKNAILEKMGKRTIKKALMEAYIKEGVHSQIRISSRQIGRFIGVSFVKANGIIKKLQSKTFIKTRFPIYPVRNVTFKQKKEFNLWQCERVVFEIKPMLKDSIIPVQMETPVLCK